MNAVMLTVLVFLVSCSRTPSTEQKAEPPPPLGVGNIARLDRAFSSIATESAQIQKIAGGYDLTDAPFYSREGYLLFSDVKRNTIYKWTPDGTVAEFRKPGGYDGKDAPAALIGPRGITVDKQGQLLVCEAGNRRISGTDRLGNTKTLVDRFEGKRLNSPQDLVFSSDGTLYFTDPPFGLAGQDKDPAKELKLNGVYRMEPDGKIKLLTGELSRPIGIALSHDEKYLFVTNADAEHRVLMRYEVRKDGTIEAKSVFFDFSKEKDAGVPGGVKLDTSGNVYVAGPGGVFVLSSEGKHLGTLQTPQPATNIGWGKYADTTTASAMASEEYATTLYITGGSEVYRIALTAVGVRP